MNSVRSPRQQRSSASLERLLAAAEEVLRELSGVRDPIGYELKATVIAVADELAGAAQLVTGKLDRIPVSIVRGLDLRGDGRATEIPIPPERDLFG